MRSFRVLVPPGQRSSMSDSIPLLDLRLLARTALAGLEYYGINPPFAEPEHLILPRLVKEGGVAVDVGANVGAYTCHLSRLVGLSGHVVAFEPYPPAFRKLASLLRLLAISNVTARNVAITDEPGVVRLAMAERAIGGSLHGFVHQSTATASDDLKVEGHTLDEEVARMGLRRIDLIKCDVEGGEAAVIRGARETLERHRPVLICEIDDRWSRRYGRSRSQVIEQIRQSGYRTVCVTFRGGLVPADQYPGRGTNLIFLP